jgi:DNA-binding response OmpR family regulator
MNLNTNADTRLRYTGSRLIESPCVLIVEDEADVRHLMTVVLQRAGYEIISVSNLAEARAALSLHEFHAAVIDLCLPDGRGDQVAELVRAQYPETRIVMTSAFAHASLMLQVAADAGDTFIAKPFRNSELVAAMRDSATSIAS